MMFRRQKTEFIGAIADIGWLLIIIVCPREETYFLFQLASYFGFIFGHYINEILLKVSFNTIGLSFLYLVG
jgi:hypothetical protein